jgi:hypothetical protein
LQQCLLLRRDGAEEEGKGDGKTSGLVRVEKNKGCGEMAGDGCILFYYSLLKKGA